MSSSGETPLGRPGERSCLAPEGRPRGAPTAWTAPEPEGGERGADACGGDGKRHRGHAVSLDGAIFVVI